MCVGVRACRCACNAEPRVLRKGRGEWVDNSETVEAYLGVSWLTGTHRLAHICHTRPQLLSESIRAAMKIVIFVLIFRNLSL